MKRLILAAGLTAVLAASAAAAEPITLTDKADRLDLVIYGAPQEGAFIDRVDDMEKLIFGRRVSTGGLSERVNGLYRDVIRDPEGMQPSISTRLNTLEYYLTDEIKQDSFESRTERLENAVYGYYKTGSIETRVNELERSIYGDTHFELVSVTLPADTVFKISLNEAVSTKTSQEGDVVHFTVQEDVKQDGVLVLPRGAQGSGHVTKVSKPKMFGRSGNLEISFNQVFTIDEEEIPTVLGPEAQEKLKMEAAAVGASAIGALVLGPVGLVGGLFVKGKNVELPAGTELFIQTQQEVETHGMQQAPGAPRPVFHRNGRTAGASMEMSDKVRASVLTSDEEYETKERTGSAADMGEDPTVEIISHE